jgi:outer membrane protein assembly factor BamB
MQRTFVQVGSRILGLGLLLLGGSVQAYITELYPLRRALHEQHLIFTAKVEKLDPDKPSVVLQLDENLKGEASFKRLPINLTPDSTGKREDHTAKLLKRLAPDLSVVVFASKIEKRYTAFGYTNGTWFQIIGRVTDDPATVRWSFTHCEPYLRRTFKGTTDELIATVRDGLAGKKEPPPPDDKEPPGLGPELKPEEKPAKKGQAASGAGPLFAVIPTFVIIGPLALLATIFPAVFGGLALLMRRWLVLLSVASLDSTLYLAHAWFRGSLKDSWWGTPPALWCTLTVVALLGAFWSWRRHRITAQTDPGSAGQTPRWSEQVILWLVSLTGLGIVLTSLRRGTLLTPPWKDLLVIWVVAWIGALYTFYRRWTAAHQNGTKPVPTTEGTMLWALVFACAGLGAATLPRQTDLTVQKLWTFEAEERGAILSSPRVEGDRVYVGAIHSSGLAHYGAVYCLERDTGQVLWRFTDDGDMQQLFSTPCLADGRLFIGEGLHEDRGCKFYCLDAATGSKLWQFETASHTESSPCAGSGKVFFGAGDDGLYCFDYHGKEQWHFQEPLHIDANPLVVGDRLYCGSGISRTHKTTAIFCLDTETGKVVWRHNTPLPAWGSPAADGNQVFFGLGNGKMDSDAPPPEQPAGAVLCVDARTGETQWQCDVSNAVLVKPAVSSEAVYIGSRDRHCYCVARSTGKVRWTRDMGSPVVAAPTLLDGRLYVVAREGRVSCLEADSGELGWTFDVAQDTQTRPQLISSPAVIRTEESGTIGHRIYFGAGLENSISSAAAVYCLQGPQS